MKQSSIIRLVGVPFVLMRITIVILALITPFILIAQTEQQHNEMSHHHSEDVHFRVKGEILWNSIDFNSFRSEITKSLKISQDNATLFFLYSNDFWTLEKINFFRKAGRDEITSDNLEVYLTDLKNRYLGRYPTFLQEKDVFALEIAALENHVLVVNGPCVNMDFETGQFSPWEGAIRERNTARRNDPVRPGPWIEGFGQHCIMTPTMRDPLIPDLPVVAAGGNHSVRLGNTVAGGHMARIRQTFMVDSSNMIFTYKYAVVLEDPQGADGHEDLDRPHFQALLYDQNGDLIECAGYSVVVASNLSGFNNVCVDVDDERSIQNIGCPPNDLNEADRTYTPGSRGCGNNSMDLYYKNWTTVSVALNDYYGQNVTIEFLTSDCVPSGHLGYAYVEADCLPLSISKVEPICSGKETRTIVAPEGFETYSWTGPSEGITGGANSQTISIQRSGTYTVTLMPYSDNPCPVTLDYLVGEYCPPRDYSDIVCETVTGSGVANNIDLTNYNLIVTENDDNGNVESWHTSIPVSNTNRLTDPTNINVSNGNKYYALVNNAFRKDTVELTITVNSNPIITFPDIENICAGSPSVQINNVSPAGGVFSGINVSSSGIFNPVESGDFSIQYKVQNSEGCSDSLTKNVIVDPVPTVDAGEDQIICASDPEIDLTGIVTNATGGVWSGGEGTMSPSHTSLDVKYTASLNEITTGNVTLTLTSRGSGSCPDVTDDITIEIIPVAVVLAGDDQVLCANELSVTLEGSENNTVSVQWTGGNGLFNNVNTVNPSYVPTEDEKKSGGITLTLTGEPGSHCNAVSDQVVILFDQIPTVDAGSDQTLCLDNAVASLTAINSNSTGVLWSGGSGSINGSNTDHEISYTPGTSETTSGEVTLTVTTTGNGECPAAEDQVVITYVSVPEVDAGNDQRHCASINNIILNAVTANSNSVLWSGGAGTYTPGASSPNATYIPTQDEKLSGQVILTISVSGGASCPNVSDELIISFDQEPTIDAGADQAICASNSVATLTANFINSTGVIWSGGDGSVYPASTSQAISYTPLESEIMEGEVILTVTTTGNGECPVVSDQVIISYIPVPVVSAGEDQTLCADVSSVSLSGSVLNVADFSWTGGNGEFNPDPNTAITTYIPTEAEKSAGLVTMRMEADGISPCPQISDEVTIFFDPLPTAEAGEDQVMCAVDAVASLSSNGMNYSFGIWTGGSGQFSPGASSSITSYIPTESEIVSGKLVLTFTTEGSENCPSAKDSLQIMFIDAPSVNAGPDKTVCANNSAVEILAASENTPSVKWFGGSGNFSVTDALSFTYIPSPEELLAGNITLTITSAGAENCPDASDEMVITINPSPQVDAGPDVVICDDISSIELIGTSKFADEISWEGGEGEYSSPSSVISTYYPATPENSEIITLKVTARAEGCLPVADDMQLRIVPLPVISLDDITACEETSVVLSVIEIPGATYTWAKEGTIVSSDQNSLNVSVETGAHLYTVTVTTPEFCSNSDEGIVTGIPVPIVEMKDHAVCLGQIAELNLSITNQASFGSYPVTYTWYKDGVNLLNNSSSYSTMEPGHYQASVSVGVCKSSSSGTVTIYPEPESAFNPEYKFCSDNETVLSIDAGQASAYYWYPTGDTTQVLTVKSSGGYQVLLTNEYGCSKLFHTKARNICPPQLHISNAFSPNADGENDQYTVYGEHIGAFRMLIFNRWGEVIFESLNMENVWDGKYRAEEMPIGVYPWLIIYEGDSPEYKGPYKKEGSVTVVR